MSFLVNPFIYAVVGCSGNLISTTNLLGYYKFEGNVNDYSGQANNATGTSLSYTSSGWYQSGGTFDGSATLVNMPSKDYSMATGYTITAWIKTNTSRVSPMQIMARDKVNYGAANRRVFQFRVDGTEDGVGKLRFVRFSNNTTVVSNFTSTGTVNTGNWVHVAAVFDNTVGSKIYINGVQDGSDSVTTNNNNVTDSNIRIGALEENVPGGIALVFSGNTDEVTFWNRPLSVSEIQTLAQSTCPLNPDCPANIISSSNLIGYWKFDGNTNDSSGNGYTLTQVNSPTFSIGKFNNAIDFEASSSQYVYSDSYSSNGVTNMTFACWFKLESSPASNVFYHLVSKYSTGANQYGFEASYFNDAGTNKLYFNIGSSTAISAMTLSTDVWYHLAGTYNSSGVARLYLNGSLVTSASGTARTLTNPTRTAIGAFYDNNNVVGLSRYFDGMIDDAVIFHRELSASEIQTIYNSTCPLKS